MFDRISGFLGEAGAAVAAALVRLAVVAAAAAVPPGAMAAAGRAHSGAEQAPAAAGKTRPGGCPTDTTAAAREGFRGKVKRTGSLLYRFVKNFDEYDTDYITPNYYNYTAMLQNTNFYQRYILKGTDEAGRSQSLHLAPAPAVKIGPYFGWRWIFLGYTFDVSHPRAAGKTTEFNLSLYSSMIGGDVVYIRNTGDFTLRRAVGFDEGVAERVRGRDFSGMDTYTASINVYYVFNHRHFSYPAAFAQSTVQRRSCGSWILGFQFAKQKIAFDHTRLPAELTGGADEGTDGDAASPMIDELKFRKIDYRNYSVSGGYAYNWVFLPGCLLSVSLTPSVGFKQAKGERLRSDLLWTGVKNMNFDFVSRVGLVWNNTKWFAGASLISHLYDYRRDRMSLTNSINYLNVYAGFCFNRKSQYRRR